VGCALQIQVPGSRVYPCTTGFRVSGSGFRVPGSGFRVQDSAVTLPFRVEPKRRGFVFTQRLPLVEGLGTQSCPACRRSRGGGRCWTSPTPRRSGTRPPCRPSAALRRYSSQFKNNCFTDMCSGSEAGSYLRLIDFCITQL